VTSAHPVEIVALLVSPVHAYEGRPRDGPRPDAGGGARDHIDIRAGLGIVGDRYHAQAAHRHAAVTVFAAESLDAVTPVAGSPPPDPLLTRRNVVLRGFPVDELASARDHDGAEFSLDSGGGPIRFRAHRPARAVGWMSSSRRAPSGRCAAEGASAGRRSTTAGSTSAPPYYGSLGRPRSPSRPWAPRRGPATSAGRAGDLGR